MPTITLGVAQTSIFGATVSFTHSNVITAGDIRGYFTTDSTPVTTAQEIHDNALTEVILRGTSRAFSQSGSPLNNDIEFNLNFGNISKNGEQEYLHWAMEDGVDTGIFVDFGTIPFTLDYENPAFLGEVTSFEEDILIDPATRTDIDFAKILFLINPDGVTDNTNTDEMVVDDYIAAYKLTPHKINVDHTAANFDPSTLWLGWMKGVADYIEANDIEAVFVSPNFSLWLPYPEQTIVNSGSETTSGKWGSGCAAQMVGSIPLIKKWMDTEVTTDYSQMPVGILNSDILSLDTANHNARAASSHLRFSDVVSYDVRGTVGGRYLTIDGKPVHNYAADWTQSIGQLLDPPEGGVVGNSSSSEQDLAPNAGTVDISLSITALRALDQLDRLPNGRIGLGAITGTGEFNGDTYRDSPSMSRAATRSLVQKSKAVRGGLAKHASKPVLATMISRIGPDVTPQLGMITHNMYTKAGFRNLQTMEWSDEANVTNAYPRGKDSRIIIDEAFGATGFGPTFQADFEISNNDGTGSSLYVNPRVDGDYSNRLGGLNDLNFRSFNGKAFPQPMWMWFGGGLENTDKSGSGHIFNSGEGFTIQDGAMYHSNTSFGHHLGRWFLLAGGCCTIGSLRLEAETDPLSTIAGNEIELSHHTSAEIDGCSQVQHNLLRGHSAAWSHLFQQWSGTEVTQGYARSEEVIGDPLYSPFALELTPPPVEYKATTMKYMTQGYPDHTQFDALLAASAGNTVAMGILPFTNELQNDLSGMIPLVTVGGFKTATDIPTDTWVGGVNANALAGFGSWILDDDGDQGFSVVPIMCGNILNTTGSPLHDNTAVGVVPVGQSGFWVLVQGRDLVGEPWPLGDITIRTGTTKTVPKEDFGLGLATSITGGSDETTLFFVPDTVAGTNDYDNFNSQTPTNNRAITVVIEDFQLTAAALPAGTGSKQIISHNIIS